MVDDEKDLEFLARQKFRKALAAEKFQLIFAQNGRDALSIIENDPEIAVIISDINMPEMDGLTLLKHTHTLRPHIRTILVSAYGDLTTLRKAMNYRAFDFVTKPVDFQDLEESILRALEI
ncbi:Response regulator [Candidatus Bealeia paramacronuclearis]|uniref:Response regulator n=2 Tax=Candidatus Bealeia paramacronuclearis TaxID=1921001 RepID=A0ABZ2C7L4_9PROT|nr:Response regulator [Candidatus Bealeia paramacronuclearis]